MQPKPIRSEEMAAIIARIGWPVSRLAEVAQCDPTQTVTDPNAIRRLRALALDQGLRDSINEWRKLFPGTTFDVVTKG